MPLLDWRYAGSVHGASSGRGRGSFTPNAPRLPASHLGTSVTPQPSSALERYAAGLMRPSLASHMCGPGAEGPSSYRAAMGFRHGTRSSQGMEGFSAGPGFSFAQPAAGRCSGAGTVDDPITMSSSSSDDEHAAPVDGGAAAFSDPPTADFLLGTGTTSGWRAGDLCASAGTHSSLPAAGSQLDRGSECCNILTSYLVSSD